MARAMNPAAVQPGTFIDAVGQTIQVGDTVLYAGYSSNRLSRAMVGALRERNGRAVIVAKLHNARGTVSLLHYPGRVYVLRVSSAEHGAS